LRATRIALSLVTTVILTALVASTAVAASAAGQAAAAKTYSYDFSNGAEGWSADFSDYSPSSIEMELQAGVAPLPTGTADGDGFFIQGNNHSDDLYMFLKRHLGPADGITAGRRYSVQSSVTFWSNSPDCVGVGGSAGGSVYLKAGASTAEPVVSLVDNRYQVSLDKNEQAGEGTDATVLGNIDSGETCKSKKWVKVTRMSSTTLEVRADDVSNLWLNVGTESGFEGLTKLYYSNVSVTLTPR